MAAGSKDVSAIYELLYNPAYRPRASPNAHIEALSVDDKPSFILMKASEAEYYEVDALTERIWRLLDGRRTVSEIVEEVRRTDSSVSENEVRDTLASLAEDGFIESTEPELKHKRVEVISAFQLDVHLVNNSSESLAGFFRVTRKLIRGWEFPVAIGISALGFVLFFTGFVRIFEQPQTFDVAGSAVLGYLFYQLFMLLPVYAVHELAHAAVCDYYGGKPREIGTGLYYLAPFFYCDTSDSWRLSRRARIMISVAGPLSTLVISSLLVLTSFLIPAGYPRDALQIAAFFGYYGTLTNFSPVIETDGYYILTDALNIPNLRDEVFGLVKRGFLTLIGRPVRAVRRSARHRRIVAIYTVITIAWFAFFGYSTTWLLGVYGRSAYTALVGISLTLVRARAFDPATFGVNVATIGYFGLTLAGFAVMGVVASRRIRMRGVKLETIHDKRVSVFLPLPSSVGRSRGSKLAARARRLASRVSLASSVTLEPPLCVATLKLGKVDQSIADMKEGMQKVEQEFRLLHAQFVSTYSASRDEASRAPSIARTLTGLAGQFPANERKSAIHSASRFLRNQDEAVRYLLESSFGAVWTLELSPDDYKKLRREAFPGIIAEDMSGTDLPTGVEEFKRRTVVGYDAIAELSSEIESESREVSRNLEVYQITAFLEPMKSRLVFLGRTDRVEGSVVWLGGLFLYQAWVNYIGEELEDASLGLKSIRLASSRTVTKGLVAKMSDIQLHRLEQNLSSMDSLDRSVEEALTMIESTFESAVNFHETLASLVSDESFDIGLYKPILSTNGRRLDGVRGRIEEFRGESRTAFKRFAGSKMVVSEELLKRASENSASGRGGFERMVVRLASRLGVAGPRSGQPGLYETEVKLMFATSRLLYGIVVCSDIIL